MVQFPGQVGTKSILRVFLAVGATLLLVSILMITNGRGHYCDVQFCFMILVSFSFVFEKIVCKINVQWIVIRISDK